MVVRDASMNEIDLPGTNGVTSAPLPLAPEAIPGGRVLLADDDDDLRDYLSRILEKRWTVEAVSGGAAALAAARLNRPDVILTAVGMPGLDGPQVLRELGAGDPGRRRGGGSRRLPGEAVLGSGAAGAGVHAHAARALPRRVRERPRQSNGDPGAGPGRHRAVQGRDPPVRAGQSGPLRDGGQAHGGADREIRLRRVSRPRPAAGRGLPERPSRGEERVPG